MSALFVAPAERDRAEAALGRALAAARERVAQGSVAPVLGEARLRPALAAHDFAAPRPLQAVIDQVIDWLVEGATQTTHPRYFGLFNPAPCFAAECADRIVAQFNPQLASATTSPAPVAIEAHVIAAVARRAGLGPAAGGHFTSGGSEANFTALLCALHRAEAGYLEQGLAAFAARPVFYVSRDCHLAWHKIAVQAGLGHAAMRQVATDGAGRMAPAALRAAIAADRVAGLRPVMIVATAGTTAAGMVDPLDDCAAVARCEGLWLHVDAAWGGALIACPGRSAVLAGIEQADSVTIDAHKWFAVTMGCGMFLARDPAVLGAVFAVQASFMPGAPAAQDPYLATLQWSRRFVGLRLFLALASAGWQGFADHVEHAIGLAALLARTLAGCGWTVANASPMAVLCLIPPDHAPPVARIVRQIVQSGAAWVSTAVFEGRDVIRVCITHGQTTPQDVLMLARVLQECASTVQPGGRRAGATRDEMTADAGADDGRFSHSDGDRGGRDPRG